MDDGHRWIEPLPLNNEFEAIKGCPKCKQPIRLVRRYGRIVNKMVLDLTEMVFLHDYQMKLCVAWEKQIGIEKKIHSICAGDETNRVIWKEK